MAELLQGKPEEILRIAEWLRAGEIAALPTETVYGLAGNACLSTACQKIFSAKERPSWDPLIVHVLGISQAEEIALVSPEARKLMNAFWPGPLTLILPSRGLVAPEVSAGRDTVALRQSAHPLFHQVLEALDFPLAAPSANPFGYLSPTRAEDVQTLLGDRIHYILDGGPCGVGVESTILDLTGEVRRILRPGGVGQEVLEAALGHEVQRFGGEGEVALPTNASPGLAPWHYSPLKPLRLWSAPAKVDLPFEFRPGDCLLRTNAHPRNGGEVDFEIYLFQNLAERESEIARSLYRALLEADRNPDIRRIVVERPDGSSPLIEAVLQRLSKASARFKS